jgi:hypothetical protein
MAVVVVTGASCSVISPKAKTTAPPVLGQPTGTAAAVGQPAPAGTGELSAVSCPDADHCWAVGVAGPNAPTTTAGTGAAATPAVTVIAATVDGGLTWHAQPLAPGAPAPALTGVSCPSTTDCMAVGSTGADPGTGVVLTTTDGGKSWVAGTPPAGSVTVASVRCDTAATCTAVASDGTADWSTTTVNFGRTWTQQGSLPPGIAGALALTCTPTGTCLVAGFAPAASGHGQGAVAISTDGGTTWAAATVPAGVGLLQSVTCASPTRCLAAGTTSTTVSDVVPAKGLLLASADGGHTWTAATAATAATASTTATSGTTATSAAATLPVDDVFGLACPASTACVMVGTKWVGTPATGTGAVAESRDAGAAFTASSTAYTPLTLTAVDCPTAARCVAVGGDTVARITLPPPATTKNK